MRDELTFNEARELFKTHKWMIRTDDMPDDTWLACWQGNFCDFTVFVDGDGDLRGEAVPRDDIMAVLSAALQDNQPWQAKEVQQ